MALPKHQHTHSHSPKKDLPKLDLGEDEEHNDEALLDVMRPNQRVEEDI